MASVNECKWQALTAFLATGGAVPELELEYVQTLQNTRHPVEPNQDQLSDAWQALMFLDTGIEDRNESTLAWLKAEGAVGEQVSDLWEDYWCVVAGGGGGGAFDDGFSDGFG